MQRRYAKTFLNPEYDGLSPLEEFIDGIKHEHRTVDENIADGFFFEDCSQADDLHSIGTIYIFRDKDGQLWGYVCEEYNWYRFNYVDLLVKSN